MSGISKEYRALWAARNPLYNNDYQRTWRKGNPDKVKAINAKSRRKLMSIPEKREHQKVVRNAWYQRNKAKLVPVYAKSHRKRADVYFEFKQKQKIGCLKCGYNAYGAALDFHHRDPAHKLILVNVSNYKNKKGRAEIEKCDLLCANCHRVETVQQRRNK